MEEEQKEEKEIRFMSFDMKLLGVLDCGIFKKNVRPKNHLMKIYDAYGIDEKVFNSLKGRCDKIVFHEHGGDTLSISYEQAAACSMLKQFGHGMQYFIKRQFMTKE